jgi:hypothetical protein
MNAPLVEPDDQSQPDAVFQRVMAAVAERACAEGREGDVMEALFPVFLGGVHDGEDLGL